MITIFSTLKPGDDYRQRNAVKSWAPLPRSEVLLIGKEAQSVASEFGVALAVGVQRSALGMPLLNSLFEIAQAPSPCNLFLYVNADIVLWGDVVLALEACAKEFPAFLMVGQRTDLDVKGPIDCGEHCLRQPRNGRLLSPCGCDYFGFTRGLWPEILPYAIGRTAFDNWLIWSALEAGSPVVDVTKAVTVVHQRHPESSEARMNSDAKRNRGLVPLVGKGHVGWVDHSTYVMDSAMQIKERGK
jgi:hypothetical protein